MKVLAVTGPHNCDYPSWFQVPDDKRAYSQRKFFEWIFSGMTCGALALFGPGYTDEIPKQDRPVDLVNPVKKREGLLSVVIPAGWALAPDIQLYLDTRRTAPYFPRTQLTYSDEGAAADLGLYLEPLGAPSQEHALPPNWLYWPQSRYM